MSEPAENFDAYHRWLGISPKDQPPNHYRLLAIDLFESDADVIRDAAERQSGHVRRYQLGRHMAVSQTILNQIAAAKACLTDPLKKAAYDQTLRESLAPPAAPPIVPTPPVAPPPVVSDAPLPPVQRPRRKPRQLLPLTVIGLLAVGLLGWGYREKLSAWKTHLSADAPADAPAAAGYAELTNSIGLKLVRLPAGEFAMGADSSANERPVHRVRISKPFYIGATEITQGQYEQVMGKNPSSFPDEKQQPVEQVSWDEAVEFCKRLSAKEGRRYFLPSEAQWEYACRAGSSSKWCCGDDEAALADYAWYAKTAEETTHPVAEKKPNAWGLYDLHGNVWEWCADYYSPTYYADSPADDPPGPAEEPFRVARGGGWFFSAGSCRAASRGSYPQQSRSMNVGFRVCLEAQ